MVYTSQVIILIASVESDIERPWLSSCFVNSEELVSFGSQVASKA